MAARERLEIHRHSKFQRLVVHQRPRSRFYQARCHIDGRLFTNSCKTAELTTAMRIASEWYRSLLRDQQAQYGRHPSKDVDPTLSEKFADYKRTLKDAAALHAQWRWNAIHDFWGRKSIHSITPSAFHEFYARRRRNNISNHTLHKDVTLIRQILKYCAETELLTSLPIIPRIGKIAHNPRKWLDRVQWEILHKASRLRIEQATERPRLQRMRQDCHDFMVFMLNSMLRVDELRNLTFGDCRVVENADKQRVLELNVRISKTGPRSGVLCTAPATFVFDRRVQGHAPGDKVFPRSCGREFKRLLESADLYRDGAVTRNLKSLRATSISFRILERADVAMVAKNAGTSINSINNFYARYLRGTDAIEQMTKLRDEYMLRDIEKHQDDLDAVKEMEAHPRWNLVTGDKEKDLQNRRRIMKKIAKKYQERRAKRDREYRALVEQRKAARKKTLPD